MKINYYFRPSTPGVYSIERVFSIIINEIENKGKCKVEKVYVKKHIDISSIFEFRYHKADIYHITGAINYIALGLPKNKTILTIHDIGYFETVRGLKKFVDFFLNYYFVLRRVKLITVVSDFTKMKIIEKFNVNPNKIIVIPNPLPYGFKFTPKPLNKIKPVILQIGAGRHKNLEALIEAIKNNRFELRLIRAYDKNIDNMIKNTALDVVWKSNLNDKQVIEEYINCDIVYFASTHEGFGIPILESFAIGRPIITSNISPMKEISGNAAWLVNPTSVNEISNTIVSIITDDITREKKIKDGLNIVKDYSPENISSEYLSLYNSLQNTL